MMNIAVLFNNTPVFDLPFRPIKILSSDEQNKLIALRDLSLELDKSIYLDRSPVDWVLYCINPNIIYEDFVAMEKYISQDSRNIFFTEENTMPWAVDNKLPAILGNFYCRPQVFSLLGNAYKLKNFTVNLRAESTNSPIDSAATTLIYAINRTGYKIKRIPSK